MEDTDGSYALPELDQATKVEQQALRSSPECSPGHPATVGDLFDHRLSSIAHSTSLFQDIFDLMSSHKGSTPMDDLFSEVPIPATHSLLPNALDSMGSCFARQSLLPQEPLESPPSLEYPLPSLPIHPYHQHDRTIAPALSVDAFLSFNGHSDIENSKISAWEPSGTSVASLAAAANDTALLTPPMSPSTCASSDPLIDSLAIMMGYLPGSTVPTIADTRNACHDVSPRGKRRASEYSDDDDLPASTDDQSTVDDSGTVYAKRLAAWKPQERLNMVCAASQMAPAPRQPTNPNYIDSPTSSAPLSLSPPITQSRLAMSPPLQADYRRLSLRLSDISPPAWLHAAITEKSSLDQQGIAGSYHHLRGLMITPPQLAPDQPQYFQPSQHPQNHLQQGLPSSYTTIHPSDDTTDVDASIVGRLMSGAETADGSHLSPPIFSSSQLQSSSDGDYFGYHPFHLKQVHRGHPHTPLRHSQQYLTPQQQRQLYWYGQAQAQQKQRTRRQSDDVQMQIRRPPHSTPTTPQQHVTPLEHLQIALIPKPSISSHAQVLGSQGDKIKVPLTIPDIDGFVRDANPEEQGTQSDDESTTTLCSSHVPSQVSLGEVRTTTHRRSNTGPSGLRTASPDSMRTLTQEIPKTSGEAPQPQHYIQPTASTTMADMSGFLEAHTQTIYTNHLVLDSGFKFSTPELMHSADTVKVHNTTFPHRGENLAICGTINSNNNTGSSNTNHKRKTNGRSVTGKPRAPKNVCDKCGRAYTRPFNLRSHRLTHDDKKPFGCQTLIGVEGCALYFTRRHDLIRHIRAKHPGVHWSSDFKDPDTLAAPGFAVTTSVAEEEELDTGSEAFAAFIVAAAVTEEEHVKEEVHDMESEAFAAFIATAAVTEEESAKEEVLNMESEDSAAFATA